MQKITQNIRLWLVQHQLIPSFLIVVGISAFFLVFLRLNNNAAHTESYHEDEYHTLVQGIQYIEKGTISNFRVTEGTRRLVEIIYPFALIRMAQQMGGEHFTTGWAYPGHNYVLQRYTRLGDNEIRTDPNIRDFLYSMRMFYVVLVYLTFLPIFWVFCKDKSYAPIVLTILLIGTCGQLQDEQSFFYVEPAMIMALNSIMAFYLLKNRNTPLTVAQTCCLGILSGFMISTKVSTIFFLLFPLEMLREEIKRNVQRSITILINYVASTFASIYLINLPAAKNYNSFLHDFVSNFYHYSTGHLIPDTPGIPAFIQLSAWLSKTLGFTVYLLPLLIPLGIFIGEKNPRKKFGILLTIAILATIYSLINQRIQIIRNYLPIYPAIVILVGLCLQNIIIQIQKKGPRSLHKYAFQAVIGIFLSLSYAGIIMNHRGLSSFLSSIYPSQVRLMSDRIREVNQQYPGAKIYLYGLSKDLFNPYFNDRNTFEEKSTPEGGYRFPEYEASVIEKIDSNSIAIVYRKGNNKQLTNYILPKIFSKNKQYGDYFIFYSRN
jgi:hypothetical protein